MRTTCCTKRRQAQLAAAQEARKLREQAQAAEEAQMLGAANATAVEAGVALTERHYTQAAKLFGEAAEYAPTGHWRISASEVFGPSGKCSLSAG